MTRKLMSKPGITSIDDESIVYSKAGIDEIISTAEFVSWYNDTKPDGPWRLINPEKIQTHKIDIDVIEFYLNTR